ncbi:MAG: hypothetical protein H7X99_02750 [Saprospiraceae bacterium]|nr:hypothetical protein [Saprospiraceae bacterium]
MKYIALIFAFIIFGQSLSVCAPDIALVKKTESAKECHADVQKSPKHSCCKNNDKDDDDTKDGCCGEGCKCFSCFKVFIPYFQGNSEFILIEKLIAERNISPVLCHSFDFHYTIINPPQVR